MDRIALALAIAGAAFLAVAWASKVLTELQKIRIALELLCDEALRKRG